jgi:ribosome-binding protein aMBF1 (putative translation factor)
MLERERIVAQGFAGLAARAQRSWDSDAQAAYAAATDAFEAEARAREALGAQLASARIAKKLSQPALSEKSGVQQAEISRIERGLANPTVTTLARLALALELRLELTPAH